MATFANSLLLLVQVTLLLSLQTLARESRFFSKVTRSVADDSKPIDDVHQVQLEAKDDADQPSFLPQTHNTAAYGLYGRLTQTDSTAATTTNKYQEPTYDNNKNTNYFNNLYNFESTTKDQSTATEPEFYDNYGQSKNYAQELRGAYTKAGSGNGGYYKYNTKKSGGGWNGEKQGMSDTRFLENGRYFYDLENEKPTNDVQSYNNAAFENGSYFSDLENQKPTNQVRSYNNGRRSEYYNNEGYYSGSTQSYKNTGNGFRGGEQEEEFDFDP